METRSTLQVSNSAPDRLSSQQQVQNIKRYSKHLYDYYWHALNKNKLSPNRFIVFGRGRSGSYALQTLLNSLPNVRCDGEILARHVLFPYTYILAKCAYSKANTYGCKILTPHIKWVQNLTDRDNFIRYLNEQGFKIIYLKRENVLFHALSNVRARVFGFHKKSLTSLHRRS